MTKLIVSVRNIDEARQAREGGADVVDVKEPTRGSLGAADGPVVRAIAAVLEGSVPWSVALGELLDAESPIDAADLRGASYAKLGLAGCNARSDWEQQWRVRIGQLPAGVRPVAVVYADRTAGGPTVEAVVSAAENAGAAAVLVDTYDKRGGNLLSHWSVADVSRFFARGRDAGLEVALAGSLDLAAIRKLLPLGPDYIAVRGAVCRGGRHGELDRERVRELAKLVEKKDAKRGRAACVQ